MIGHAQTSEPIRLRLTQRAGVQLCEQIENVMGRIVPLDPSWELESICQDLDEANAVAQWLREDVTIDLAPDKASVLLAVIEFIQAQNEDHPAAEIDLHELRQQVQDLSA
jgi:hypothetical protein